MKLSKVVRRFLMPSFVVTGLYLCKYGCKISYRSEVDWSRLVRIGRGTQISSFSKIKANGDLEIGEQVQIGTGCFISSDAGGVRIGDHCMIGANTNVVGNNYKYDRLDIPTSAQITSKGIVIEENVWIGSGCSVLDGAVIGANVIVTPNSVVTGRIPKNTIVQGNPAKVIFTRR